MNSNTSVAIMFISGFATVAVTTALILNYRLKSHMIKSGLLNREGIELMNQLNGDTRMRALKYALLLFFGGLGLVVLQWLPFNANSPLPYGIEGIFVALGYYCYYFFLTRKPQQ